MINYKDDLDSYKDIVDKLKQKYGFKGLWHFTDFTNLESIFGTGMLSSRETCKDNNIAFLDGANHNIIDRATEFVHSCTRFYYRPSTPTLYENEGIKSIQYSNEVHIPRPVYLLFSEELIYNKETVFSSGNATNSSIGDTVEFFEDMDWHNIFHSTWFSGDERNNIINKRQAELLSKESVSLENLIHIIFRSKSDLKQAINIWGKNSKYIVNESYFSDKHQLPITDSRYYNYINDYLIEYSLENMEVVILLKSTLKNYKVSWSVEDIQGDYKTNLVKKNLSIRFKDQLNNRTNVLGDALKIQFKFNYSFSNGDIIKIYLNNILSIKELVTFK